MAVSFGGLVSGLDTTSLISSLVAAERSSAKTLTGRQSDLNTHKSIVNSLSSSLSTLATSARALSTSAGVALRTASSSSSHVSVAASAGASAIGHSVRVEQLARAQVSASRTFLSPAAGALGTGSVDITTAGVTKSVSWTSDDSLQTIATRLNDANAGATASVLFDGTAHRLVLTASKSGTAAAPTFVDHGDGLDLALPAAIQVEAKNATIKLDGISVTRPTNVFDDALPGLTITANAQHGATEVDSAITVGVDKDALRDKVKAFVTAANAINGALHIQLDYTGTTKSTSTLFGDGTLRALQGAMSGLMSRSYGGKSLSDIGITRDRSGGLTLDESKLATAVSVNGNAVEAMFVTGGFSTAVTKLADGYTRAGDGILSSKNKSITERHKVLQTQVDTINRRADALQSSLEKQFNSLERMMSQLQGQGAYLSRII